MENPWSPDNPGGTLVRSAYIKAGNRDQQGSIILRLAENSLKHKDIANFINAQVSSPIPYHARLTCRHKHRQNSTTLPTASVPMAQSARRSGVILN